MLYAKGRLALGDVEAVASGLLGRRKAPLLYCRWGDGKGWEPELGEANTVRQVEA